MNNDTKQNAITTESVYEPPRVETALSGDDLAREIQYAGGVTVDDNIQQ